MKSYLSYKSAFILVLLLQTYLFCTAQNCTDYKLIKGYTSIVGTRSGVVEPLPGGSFLFNARTYNGNIITKVNSSGDTLWSKNYKQLLFYDSYAPPVCGMLDKNHHFFTSFGDNILLLVDTVTGALISSKRLEVPVISSLFVIDVGIASNNDKLILMKDESTYSDEGYILLRLSPDLSTIRWTKHFAAPNLYLRGFEITDDRIVMWGSKNLKAALVVANVVNGTILLHQEIQLDSGGSNYFFTDIKSYLSGYVAVITNFNNTDVSKAIIRYNSNFQITNSYYLSPIRSDIDIFLYADPNGSFTGAGSTVNSLTEFFRISSNDSVLFRNSTVFSSFTVLSDIKKTNNGYAALSSLTYNAVGIGSFGVVGLVNCDANGNLPGCTGTIRMLNKLPCNLLMTTPVLQARDTSFLTVLPSTNPLINNTFALSTNCVSANECNQLLTEGPTQLCGSSTAIYKVKRNSNCTNPVYWKSGNAGMVVDELSDSTVLVRFLQAGNYELYASIISGCDTLYDTLRISYAGSTSVGQPDIGPDRQLCPQNTILLNAKKGYATYRWQNGSTDSTFLVTTPGLYHVTVTDACNNLFRDTVVVTAAPPVPLSLGPDRSKCNNDTLRLTAPSGFLNYSWGPLYNITTTNTQQVIVNPARDTTYYVKAEKTPGCFGFDTVFVKVNSSPSIDLGTDVRFCNGDSVVLRAGNGFASYAWSNGVTVPQTVVKTQGVYSVAATTSEGCTSRDTLEVLQVYANPVVTLNKDSLLCTGSSRVLDAGPSANYIWNTGQQTRTISITSTGTYSVTVTDANGCKGSDTTLIARLLPLPARFLGRDTSICSYGTLELQAAAGYKTYLWNTGAVTQKLSINQPGRYILTVTDFYNCSGKDTIDVAQRQCLTGFYMPNAFTPNNDGLNDLIRPLLFGDVEAYEFTIYNRFGEVVFTTRNTGEGWNGTHKGLVQDPGTFSWKCTYQLKGEVKQQRSGTLHLMR